MGRMQNWFAEKADMLEAMDDPKREQLGHKVVLVKYRETGDELAFYVAPQGQIDRCIRNKVENGKKLYIVKPVKV